MPSFREFIEQRQAQEERILHPKFKHWESVIQASRKKNVEPVVEINRPRDVLGYKPAKLYLKVRDSSGAISFSDSDDWDYDLDKSLVRLEVKAINDENESQRYNLFIEFGFDKIEIRYGEGFFNAVLVQYIREVGNDSPQFQEMLKYSTALAPNTESSSYAPCRESLETVVANSARELHGMLEYTVDDIAGILTKALVQNLDERFSVTNRRNMGLLK